MYKAGHILVRIYPAPNSNIITLDELIETFALVHLKQHEGRMYVLNHNGFYEPLRLLLEHYVKTGMMSEDTFSMMVFAQTVDEILDDLQN